MTAQRRKRTIDQTKVITTGSVVRIETPSSSRNKPKVTVTSESVPGHGFVLFLREHAIVGLAIGFVIGTQVQALVKLLIDSFINPAFKLLFGQALTSRTFMLHWHGRSAAFAWGAFAYGLLDFLFVLAAVYILVRSLKLEKLDKPKKAA
jgi:large-conductance mechanosensitive channel